MTIPIPEYLTVRVTCGHAELAARAEFESLLIKVFGVERVEPAQKKIGDITIDTLVVHDFPVGNGTYGVTYAEVQLYLRGLLFGIDIGYRAGHDIGRRVERALAEDRSAT